MPKLRFQDGRISIAVEHCHNSGQVVVCMLQPDSKITADEWTGQEYPTQSVIARVLARVAE